MKSKYVFFIIIPMLTMGCKGAKPDVTEGANQPHKMALIIGNPVSYGENDLLVFPIGANYNPKIEESPVDEKSRLNSNYFDTNKASTSAKNNTMGNLTVNDGITRMYDVGARQEFINPNEADYDMRNILFYSKKTGASYILSKDTIHILSFAVHKEFENPLIFYRVVKVDINLDKKYNSEDAVMLYVSDINGCGFLQITPENEQFFDYFYYPETQSILIKTAYDIDKDKKFTELDETNFREMRILKPAFGKEIFTSSLKDSLKQQISQFK